MGASDPRSPTQVQPGMALIETNRPPDAVPAVFHVDSFVSEARGFVYLCVPKTLSQALLGYLESADPAGARLGDRTKAVLRSTTPDGAPLTRFSFVRNPYSRIVAVYYNKFVNYIGSPGQRQMFDRYPGLHPDMSFDELVDWLASDAGRDWGLDPHFLPQHYFLYDVSGAPAVDLIGRQETAGDDVAELQRRLGLEVEPLPRVNSNADDPNQAFDTARRWQDVLDDRTTRILTNRYDGDFALLGYERLPYPVMPLFSIGDRPATAPVPPPRSERLKRIARRLLASLGFEVRRIRTRRAPRRPTRGPS